MFSHQTQFGPQGTQHQIGRVTLPARAHASDAAGFSLIELLVVILVIGILSAIAIPAFLSQQSKATDAQAKELARTAETAAETIATAHSGLYGEVSETSLHSEEPSLQITATAGPHEAYISFAKGFSVPNEYTVTAKATDGDELTIHRDAEGGITRECRSPNTKTGCDGGETSSW